MTSEKQYTELFTANRAALCDHSCEVLNRAREEAAEDFARYGFPSTKVERYKYTDVDAAFAPDYGLNLHQVLPPVDPYKAYRCSVPNLSTWQYFVINDTFYTVPRPATLPDGVVVSSLREAAEIMPEKVRNFYACLARTSKDGITALNTMLVQDGVFIYVPKGVKLSHPIQIVNVSAASVDLMTNRRVLMIVEDDAEAKVLFCDHSENDHNYLNTQVVEVCLERNAQLAIYSLEETTEQNKRFNNLYVEQQEGSHLTLGSITLHNGLTRNRTDINLRGENASVEAYGAVVADKHQHIDNNILVDHAACNCKSDMLYKYVLDDQSVGAFAGRVLVREGAQHTESEQVNANLCASPDARMFTQPMLEIYADDVRCNHGSTIGRFDENALFYMRQRGIEEEEARLLLRHAFINDVIRRIQLEPLRDRLGYLIEKRFRGQLDHCEGCRMCNKEKK